MDNMTREGHPVMWKIGDKSCIELKGLGADEFKLFFRFRSAMMSSFTIAALNSFFPRKLFPPPPFFSAVSLVVAGAITKCSHQHFASSGLISKP